MKAFSLHRSWRSAWCVGWLLFGVAGGVSATPAHRAALERHFDRFLARPLAQCRTCHLPSDHKFPESLEEFPHNPFGVRLREIGDAARATGQRLGLSDRLDRIADEDSDKDGVPNRLELLLGHHPGDARDLPTTEELTEGPGRSAEFIRFLSGYRWRPFEPVTRPPVPDAGVANPIDAFLVETHRAQGLIPRPMASREVLLRRVYLDLIGLNPTPEEQQQHLDDSSPSAYERLVDRLLADPRHGERWARHWMDIWRYSDWAGWTDGNQVRDSKPHVWRWRDWIVESSNSDKPYDRMLTEMLAADEIAPEDPETLRATGFLARNFKLLSREQWMEDTVKHTFQALVGVTIGCAKCHDHMTDPIPQKEYFAVRAIFEPHQIRLDRVPGELDTFRDGIARAYDGTNAPTFLFVRGDERHPLTNEIIAPAIPTFLGGRLEIEPVTLPAAAAHPDHREFVRRDTLAALQRGVDVAREALEKAEADPATPEARLDEARAAIDAAWRRHNATAAVLAVEQARESGSPHRAAATNAVLLQRSAAIADARLQQLRARITLATAATNQLGEARQKLAEADARLAQAIETIARPLDPDFTPRSVESYPEVSTGRRSAFARWLTNRANPLTARVAVNHVWIRHFGRGLVPSPSDFGRNGRPASHPRLLDWLAAEFMEPSIPGPDGRLSQPWSLHHLHRIIVTSDAYRRASTADPGNLRTDPDNIALWRMNSRRLEAEAVRDNLLHVAGSLDPAMGGPDIDHKLALTSRRRSIYLRTASEKQSEFLQIFDGPSVTECYERRPSVIPQQALALGNSQLALQLARQLARQLADRHPGQPDAQVTYGFVRVLGRQPTSAELQECLAFLNVPIPAATTAASSARLRAIENLALVLFNHSDFITIR
jgi:hypothetical protein